MRLDDFARKVAETAITEFRRLVGVSFKSMDADACKAVAHAASPTTQKAILAGQEAKSDG